MDSSEIKKIIKNSKPIYESSCGANNGLIKMQGLNEKFEDGDFYIKLVYGGDFDVLIYKFEKPNEQLDLLIGVNCVYKKDIKLKQFIETFGRPAVVTQNKIIYWDKYETKYLEEKYFEKSLKDINYQEINLHKMLFNLIFKKQWSDFIRYSILNNDGNFFLELVEFNDSYFLIDVFTS
jgi:hypothetical protein